MREQDLRPGFLAMVYGDAERLDCGDPIFFRSLVRSAGQDSSKGNELAKFARAAQSRCDAVA
jgi:hypothetical protein